MYAKVMPDGSNLLSHLLIGAFWAPVCEILKELINSSTQIHSARSNLAPEIDWRTIKPVAQRPTSASTKDVSEQIPMKRHLAQQMP
jgi:hypothetical protein